MYSNEQLNAIHFSKIGICFKFFANDDIKIAKESLANVLNKKIRVSESMHDDFVPTPNLFKIKLDDLGKESMFELITGFLPFPEAKLILSKTLKWIKENGSTDDNCSLCIKISFDDKKLGPIVNIINFDVGKFVLNFDEDKVYEAFPNRKDSIYAKSIKFILPLDKIAQRLPIKNIWKSYRFVNDDYSGVDFTNIPAGYIEFRYLGGTDYEKKYSTILLMVEHFITSLYKTLNNPAYSKEDFVKLDKILAKHKGVIESYKTYDKFKKNFPEISVMIDLKTSKQIIEMYYPKIREKIFNILTKAGMNSGLINYDSDSSKLQIKDADLKQCFEISGVDIVNCKIKGNIKQCDIFSSDINDASLFESNIFGVSTCKNCKIKDSYVSRNVEVNNCYVFGENGVFSGDMTGGVFRQGRATKFASFSDDTKVIEIEKINI